MNRRRRCIVTATLLGLASLPSSALSQQKSLKDQLVGTWAFISQEQTLPNGSKFLPFGANARGVNVYDGNGHFYFMNARQDLPKIAANNRLEPTPDEAKAIALGTIAFFGTYTVDEPKKILTVKIEASTFPNLAGTEQNWSIISIAADELKYSLEPLGGGQILSTLRSAK
jgi:Lipocalin-like domain